MCVTAGIWNVMTLGLSQPSVQPDDPAPVSDALIASQSLLLILVLVNHCTNEEQLYNPYREALFSFTSSSGEA